MKNTIYYTGLLALLLALALFSAFIGYSAGKLYNSSDYQLKVAPNTIIIMDESRQVGTIQLSDTCKLTDIILKDNQ